MSSLNDGVVVLMAMLLFVAVSDSCNRNRRVRRQPVNKQIRITCPSVNDHIAGASQRTRKVTWGSPGIWDDQKGYRLHRVNWGDKYNGAYFEEGLHTLGYSVTDSGGLTAQCYFPFRIKVVRCTGLSRPQYGSMSCDTWDNIYGTKCRFSCDSGFWLNGNSSSYCDRDGHYTRSAPTCRRKQCAPPHLPKYYVGRQCTNGRYYESICHLKCDRQRGYTARYLNYARCQANTNWRYENWNCERIEGAPRITVICCSSITEIFC